MTKNDKENRQDDGERMSDEISRDVERKLKARSERQKGVWFGLGMFGLVGWSIVIPTLLGVVLGIWLDERFVGEISWTLTLLFLGLILGCINAWYWIKGESPND
jgi:ATP synthase protein I